uniref:PAX-interacting protein 1 n=1 Tax=Anopheles minimus TaxID=112268 RepID=A0A182WAN0_9DIPT
SICPKHASLRHDTVTDKLQILDLCSIHGVTVDQKPIAPLTWIEITALSRLNFGTVVASVETDNKNTAGDASLHDEDSTDVIDCSQEETQPLHGSRKMANPATNVLATSGRRTSLIETIAAVHETPCSPTEKLISSFLVPETQQLDGTISCTNANATSVPNDVHLSEEENDDDEPFFIPETQQPEDELNCPSEVFEPILSDVPETEQPATEEEYFQMTVENDDNSNDAMFNNKYIEQSQNLMRDLDVSCSGAVVPRVSIQPERSVDSISFERHRNTTMEMSRIEWNESKKDCEQSMIGVLLQPSKEGEALGKADNITEDVDDRSITPELNFDDDPPVETVEKQTSLEHENNLNSDINVTNQSTEHNNRTEQVNRSSKTPELCFYDQENEDNDHEISLNQEGCDNLSLNRSRTAASEHDTEVTNVYDMETQAFAVDNPYEKLTQPLHRLDNKLNSFGSRQKLQLDPYELLTQPLTVEKTCVGKLSENSSFVKPKNPATQRISIHSPEIDYANMPTQQFTPPELLYQPTESYDESSNDREKCHTNGVVAGNESPGAKRQKRAAAQSKCNQTPEIDYANLPTQLFTPPEFLYQPPMIPEDSNKEPSALLINDDDLLTQPLSPPKQLMDTPAQNQQVKYTASSSAAVCVAYDLNTQPLEPRAKTSHKTFEKKKPVLKLVDIKACHMSNPIESNSKEIQNLVCDVDKNVYDLGKLKLLECGSLLEDEESLFNPQINSTTCLSVGQQQDELKHMDTCVEISHSSSNKENSREEADGKDEQYDTDDELCLAATIPLDTLFTSKMKTECVEQPDEGESTRKFKIPMTKTETVGTPKAARYEKRNNTEMTEFLTPEHPLLFLPKVDCIRSVSEQMHKQNTIHTHTVKGKPKYYFNDSSSSDDDGTIGEQLFKKTNVSVALEKELENVQEVKRLKKQQEPADRKKLQSEKDGEEKNVGEQAKARDKSRSKRAISVQQIEVEESGKYQAAAKKTSTRRRETKDIGKTSEPQKKSSRTADKDTKPERSKQSYNEGETRQEPQSSYARSSSDRSKSNDAIPVRVSTRNRVETYKKRMINESIDYLSESAKKPFLTRAGRKRKEQTSTDREEERKNANVVESKRLKSGQRITPEEDTSERSRRATSRAKKVVGTSSDLFVEQGNTSGLISGVLGYDSATSGTGSDTSAVSATRSNRLRLIFTQMNPEPYRKCIARAGGKIVDIPELATILVADRIIRTYKFLCSVAKGIPIVGQSYLDALQASDGKQHIDAWDHILSDPVKEKRYKFCLRDTLLKAKQHKLFQDYIVFVTSSTQPPPSELYLILSCAGARISKHSSKSPKDTNKMFVISDPADSASWVKFKEKFPTIQIVSAEGFMLSIMQHAIKFKNYPFF